MCTLLGTTIHLHIHLIILLAKCIAAVQCIKSCREEPAGLGNVHINPQYGEKCNLSDFYYGMIVSARQLSICISADILGFFICTHSL